MTLGVRRVLFVTHNVPRFAGDAAGSFVLRLAVALRAAGVEVDILAPATATLQGVDVIEGVPIERVRYASPSRMTLAYTGTMAEAVRGSWSGRFALLGLLYHTRVRIRQRLREALREGRPYDVVHAHWWFPSGVAAWSAALGRARAAPLVITMHGSDVRLAQGVQPSHAIMRRVLRSAGALAAVSRWLAEAARAIVPDVAVSVAPMPVDTAMFVPPPADAARAGVLFVGRLNAQKGIGDLLDALARTADGSVTLDVVGDGPDRSALEARAVSLGVAARVRWHGALPQAAVAPLYGRAAVVAIPSRDEGLGLVAVEAQLSATPVVAYASGGLLDVVVPDRGGTLVEPGDIDALARGLDRLAADSDAARARVQTLGASARSAMLHAFSPEVVAERYSALYAAALAPR